MCKTSKKLEYEFFRLYLKLRDVGFWDFHVRKARLFMKRLPKIQCLHQVFLNLTDQKDGTHTWQLHTLVVINRATQDTFSSLKVKFFYHFHIPFFFLFLRHEKVIMVAIFTITIISRYSFWVYFLVKTS